MKTKLSLSINLLEEGKKLAELAHKGNDPILNLNRAIAVWRKAIQGFNKNSQNYAACLTNEAGARTKLAELNVEPSKNLKKAMMLVEKAQKHGLSKNTESYGINLLTKATILLRFSVIGINPEKNLYTAIKFFQLSRTEGLKSKTTVYGKSFINEGISRIKLVDLGIDPIKNLKMSVQLFSRSRCNLIAQSHDFANSLLNEGIAHEKLADFGVDPINNLRIASILINKTRKIYPPDSTSFASSLINEANVSVRLASHGIFPALNLKKAFFLYEKSRFIQPNKGSTSYFKSFLNESSARIDLGEMGIDQKNNFQRALTLCITGRKGFSKDSTDYNKTLINEGLVRFKLSTLGINKAENIKLSENALKEGISFLENTKNKWNLISAYNNLGCLKYFDEDYSSAFTYFDKSICIIESLRETLNVSSYRRKYLDIFTSVYNKMVFTCVKLNRFEDAFYYTESIKGRVFLDLIGSDRKPLTAPSNVLREYKNVLKQIEQLELKNFYNYNPELDFRLNDLKKKHDDLLIKIKDSDKIFHHLQTNTVIRMNDLKKLIKGKTLVEYFIGEKLLIFVIKDKIEIRLVDFNLDEFISRINELQEALTSRNINEELLNEKLSYFYGLLIKPIRELIDEEIIIIPHGLIHKIPFSALRKEHYLIEDFVITIAFSASSLKFLKHSKNDEVLVIGNPKEDLPSAEAEALEISELFEVEPILHKNASKKKFLEKIKGKRIIHFAGHGLFDSTNPNFSGILLSDGVLTANEWINLNLNSELVVLSACETANSNITRGDEIEGLVGAVQLSGSRFVIASLWSVNDYSTCILFKEFYKEIETYPRMLRNAQINLIKSGYSLYDWAPFQIYGI